MDKDNEIELVHTIQEKDKKIKELENEIENLKMKLSIYDSENRKLKHIVMSLPNGLETLQRL